MTTKFSFKRSRRINDLLHQTISTLLIHDVKDPRVANVTLTRVECTDDLTIARVFYRVLPLANGETVDLSQVAKGLKRVSGFVRSQLGRTLH